MASEVYTYDNVGNLLTKKIGDQNPKVLEYEYFAGYRVKKITEPDGRVIDYTYDANDNILTQSCPGVSYTYSNYDARNRAHNFTAQLDGYMFDFGYNYDVFGRATSINYPNRTNAVSYNYDELDRLQSIPGFVTSCGYDADNKITDMLFGNGINNHYEYRANDDKLAGIQIGPSGSLLNLNYSYDNVGNIIQINNDFYSYDGLNRLTWAGDQPNQRIGNGTLWSYDGAGNRTNHTIYANSVVQESIDYTYDVANRLWSKGNKAYTNDSNGNRIGKTDTDIWSYIYDGENRLTQVTKNGVDLLDNSYDDSGIRVKDVKNGQTTYYVYQGNNPLMEYSLSDSKYKYLIYAGNKMVAEEKDGVVNYYHTDHLGSTRLVTDGSGNKVAEYKFKPFGETESNSGIFGTNYQFTGKPVNAEVGLSYFGARFYDPEIGRFITADTYTYLPNDERALLGNLGLNVVLNKGFDNPQEYNRYTYCCNNPINKVDADGHNSAALSWGIGIGITIAMATGVGEAAIGVGLIAAGIYILATTDYSDYDQDTKTETRDRMRSRDAKKREKKQVDDALGKDRSKREKASKDLHKDKEGGGNDRNKSYKELKDYNEEGTGETNDGGQSGNNGSQK
jgi:RHS repeat-associated protein